MNKIFIMLAVIGMTGCSPNLQPSEQLFISGTQAPASAPATALNTHKVEVKRLDLTHADVSRLTSEVNAPSVNQVISDIQRFNEKSGSEAPIYLILDTPGGSVMDGARLISTIETSRRPVYSIDTGLAASMGFMILEHSHKRFATSRAVLMAHPASIGLMFQGELDKLTSRLSFMKRFIDKMDNYIAARAGMSYEEFKLKSNRELWIDANDALEQHLLDGIVSVKLPVQSMFGVGSDRINQLFRLE